MRLCIVVASFLISPNCLAGETTNKVGSPAQEVAYCQLTEAPSSFVGKQIRVRAIYSYMFEVSRLKSPVCCPGRDVSIWIDFDEGLDGGSKKLLHKFPKGMGFVLATFEGIFQGEGAYGGGYQFKFAVDKIEKLENNANPSPLHHPSWVPKDCETSDAAPPKRNISVGGRPGL